MHDGLISIEIDPIAKKNKGYVYCDWAEGRRETFIRGQTNIENEAEQSAINTNVHYNQCMCENL